MPSGLRFDARFTVAAVANEGACLLSEREEIVLEGAVYAALASRLDGTRDTDGLVDALADAFPAAEVYHAVWELEERGYVVSAMLGARSNVQGAPGGEPVPVEVVGEVPAVEVWRSLAARGFTAADDGVAIVLTDDYLHPALAEVNRRGLKGRRPWLLAKPVGRRLWVGPVFGKRGGPCWECLRHRLARHRPVFDFLSRGGHQHPPIPLVTTAGSFQLAADLIVRRAQEQTADAGDLLEFDTDDDTLRRHEVIRRPACPACGTHESAAAQIPTPTGGQARIDPITGIVAVLTPVPDATTDAIHVWVARPSPYANATTLGELQAQRRHQSLGRGWSAEEASASALAEAIERYSATLQGNEPTVRATLRELGERAIHPNACMLFSDAQYRRRERRDASVPLPVDPDVPLDWTAVRSLRGGEERYLPTAYLYFGHAATSGGDFCRADSNGCAAGPTVRDAVRHGLCEVVERDATAIWWYNRVPRPAVRLTSDVDPALERLEADYRRTGRSFWVLDITSDLGIPVYAAVTLRDGPMPDLLVGFGCHPSAVQALRRAVSEMHQMVVALATVTDRRTLAPTTQRWLMEATPERHPHLLPAGDAPWSGPTASGDTEVETALASHGLEAFVADLTRPDIAMPVVKVLAPGLRSQRPRFAPGRLFDVPVALGWRDRPLREAELNPLPVFL